MKQFCFLFCLTLMLLLVHSSVTAQTGIMKGVIGSGSVGAANTTLHVVGTLGQPLIGSITNMDRAVWQGFWHAQSDVTASTPVPSLGSTLLSCTPNPASGPAILNVAVPQTGSVTLTLHDLLGRTVQHIEHSSRETGTFSVKLETGALPDGRYTIRYRHSNGETALPIIVVK